MRFVNRLPRLVTLIGLSMLIALLPRTVCALTTSTVQGTVYRADGKVASGTVLVSWPAFTTSANEAVAAGNETVAIGSDGWLSLGLAPNAGASPAGIYYTAVYHLNDGSTSTEYWTVPTSATVNLASVRARVVPAAVAMQSVSKQYVDSSVANVSAGLMQATGGVMNGPLTLSGDPSTNLQAATKHYVDQAAAGDVSKAGDVMTGPLITPMINGKSFATGVTLQQAIDAAGTNGAVEIPANYAGKDVFSNPHGVAVTDLRIDIPVNSRSVKEWGARCIGPSFNDHDAVQSAFDAEYDAWQFYGQTWDLVFPGGTCYVDPAIVWRGESFHGLGVDKSAIQSAPGKDALIAPDPADKLIPVTLRGNGTTITATYGKSSLPPGWLTAYGITITGAVNPAFNAYSQYPLTHTSANTFTYAGTAVGTTTATASWITRTCCFLFTRVHDIEGLVDASVDANIATPLWTSQKRGALQGSIFANRFSGWTGQTVKGTRSTTDAIIPLTTAVDLTNVKSGVAPNGWVKNTRTGEFMEYFGISNTGCPNSAPSCLLNVIRGDGTYQGGTGTLGTGIAMNDRDTITTVL